MGGLAARGKFAAQMGRASSGRGFTLRGFRSPGGPGCSRRPTMRASRRAPLPLSSGLHHRRFAVPSILPDFSRTGGTSLPLVLKSLIRLAALTASLPAVISPLNVCSFIAAGIRAFRDFSTGLITGNHLLCMYLSFYICLFRAFPGAGLAKRLSDEAARQKHYERTGGGWERRPQR